MCFAMFSAILLLIQATPSQEEILTRTMFVNAMLVDYDSAAPPAFDRGFATAVNVSLHVNGINSVNEQQMEFAVNIYLTQTWRDDRLAFSGLIPSEMLELDSKLISKFWVPDLYFVNEKDSYFHDVTVPNRLLHLYQDGTVVYKTRLTVTAACDMDLRNFPFDQQNCSLYIKSFGYSNNNLQLSWNGDEPLSQNANLKMSQFTLKDLVNRECHDLPETVDENKGNGTVPTVIKTKPLFSCLAVDFVLHRSIGFYAVQIYVPSALIVVLSWVSFVLDVAAVPARISLGILTVLTMTNMKSIAVSSLPKLSYVKAIDWWMAVCLGFVFASLLEFAIVNAFARQDSAPINKTRGPETLPLKNKEDLERPAIAVSNRCHRNGRDRARGLDNASLVGFPTAFTVFIGIYMMVYLA